MYKRQVTFSGEIIGSVYLAESINTIDDTVRTTRNSLIVFSTLIVILIGMLSLGMSYIITSPIEEFIAVAKEISKGIRYFQDFMMQWHQSLQTFRMMHSL